MESKPGKDKDVVEKLNGGRQREKLPGAYEENNHREWGHNSGWKWGEKDTDKTGGLRGRERANGEHWTRKGKPGREAQF
jgi:hypothetical protein